MSFKIVVSNTVKFKVKGTLKDGSGADQPFDFGLTAARLDADTISARLKTDSDATLADFLETVIEDWSAVKDAEDQPLPYNPANLRTLCKVPGVATLIFRTYFEEVGAKAKN